MLLSHVLTLILGSYITKLLHVKIYKETQIRVRGVGSGQVGGVLSLTSVLGVYIVPQASVKTVRVWTSESTHQAYATAPSQLGCMASASSYTPMYSRSLVTTQF